MFPLKPGGAYTVLAAVTTSEADSDVWVSAPVVIHVPEKPLVGTTRPAYGSPYYIAALQRTSREDVKLTSSVEHQIDNVFLATTLVSSDGHPIKPWLRSTDCKDAMLVFLLDDQGQPVLRNGNARAAPFCWSTGYDPVLRQATDMRNLLALDCQGGGRLSYFYSLRGGRRYSLFCASYLTGEPQGMVVARPIRFTMPTADEGRRYPLKTGRDQRVVLRTSADVMPPAIPDRNEQWKMFERFAGKSFENLRLDASITDEHESSSRPLIMNVALTNCSNESVGLTKWKGSAGFIIHVRDSSNREIELSESGKKLLGDTVAPTTCHLGPGNTVQARLPIKGLFDLRTPGDYTVLVSLPVLGDVDAVLTAAPVKLSVVAKPAEARK
jgi:hypothetical protein